MASNNLISVLRKELFLLVFMTLVGVLLVPIGVYFVGGAVFGDYAGYGFGDFYRTLHADLRNGEPVVWFLMASPWLIWQIVRASFLLFFRMSPGKRPVQGN